MADISMPYLLHDNNWQTPVPLKSSDVLYGRPLGPRVMMKLYQMLNTYVLGLECAFTKKFNYLTAHYWSLLFITLLTFVYKQAKQQVHFLRR